MFEKKLTRSPFVGLHHCTGMSVKSVEILSNHWRDEVAFKCEINQWVWNWPEGIFKVKKCYVTCSVLVLCVLDDFVHDNIVFYAAIYARKKCFLKLWVNEFVCCEKCGETFSQNEVIKFVNAAMHIFVPKRINLSASPIFWTLFTVEWIKTHFKFNLKFKTWIKWYYIRTREGQIDLHVFFILDISG